MSAELRYMGMKANKTIPRRVVVAEADNRMKAIQNRTIGKRQNKPSDNTYKRGGRQKANLKAKMLGI